MRKRGRAFSIFTLPTSHFYRLLRNIVIRVQVRSKVLVRELLRSSNLRLISDPVGGVVDHIVAGHSVAGCMRISVTECRSDSKHIVSQQSVEIHTQCLRTHLTSQRSPNLRSLGRIRQQVPSDVVESTSDQRLCFFAFRVAVRDQRLNRKKCELRSSKCEKGILSNF
jgi:hypothetical protein